MSSDKLPTGTSNFFLCVECIEDVVIGGKELFTKGSQYKQTQVKEEYSKALELEGNDNTLV